MKKLSTLDDTKDLSLIIYNDGLSSVKEPRNVSLTGVETDWFSLIGTVNKN